MSPRPKVLPLLDEKIPLKLRRELRQVYRQVARMKQEHDTINPADLPTEGRRLEYQQMQQRLPRIMQTLETVRSLSDAILAMRFISEYRKQS